MKAKGMAFIYRFLIVGTAFFLITTKKAKDRIVFEIKYLQQTFKDINSSFTTRDPIRLMGLIG